MRHATRPSRPDPSRHGTRYHIDARPVPDRRPIPHRFQVEVGRLGLARLLMSEFLHYRGDLDVVLNRPCIYGVFSGPVGGFAPRPELCVGCLRCTVQHPGVVEVTPNPALADIGDAYFTPKQVQTVDAEARDGAVPVRGQGYRGRFGGRGWDGMWTDMSEIVRPTRDGIHGREAISTWVDIGEKPLHLSFDSSGAAAVPEGQALKTISVPLPLLFDAPPTAHTDEIAPILAAAAARLGTLAVLPAAVAPRDATGIVPLVTTASELADVGRPRMMEITELDLIDAARATGAIVALRLPLAGGWLARLGEAVAEGIAVIHLVADYHGAGVGADDRPAFTLDLLMAAHRALLDAGLRDRVTLLGSGGIIAAEHVPKALICGLDAVALDTPVMVALQGHLDGVCRSQDAARFALPRPLEPDWAVQRLVNLAASWRDQLLEIMGAMGLREVRRLRGELGRAMFQRDLEVEAFGDIAGFAPSSALSSGRPA